MESPLKIKPARCSASNLVAACCIAAVGIALAAAGIHIGDIDDAPGAAVIGILLMIVAIVIAVKIALREPRPIRKNG